MGLVFTKIENGDVFTRDFNPLTRNNKIDFPTTEEIAVIYGPNGTGKTSLIKVLSDTPNTKLEFVYEGTTYTSGANVFHVVNDQNNRNIISGETRDFFLGDNIQHEFELQDLLAEKRAAFISAVLSILKGYKITTTKHPLSDLIEDESLKGFVKNCANNKSKGDQYTNEQIVNMMTALGRATVPDYDQACLNYLVEDYGKKKPVIAQIEALAGETLVPNMHVREIEENTEAMGRLAVANKLNDLHVPTVRGGKEWREGAIYLILRNEKYTGDMILQKTYSEDFRSKKRVINNGERRKYLVEKSHESIISKTVFEQVQEEIARRQSQIKMATHTFKGQFSGLLTCANCGKHFRRRIANASSKYAKPAWLCSTFATRGKRFCDNKQIPEAILISKTKEVLGLCSLDGVNLRDYISEIICHKEQNITFVLTNGDEITVAWSNSSRRNSWTEEMKQAARQKTLERSGL